MSVYDCIVIGAGISGLTASVELIEKGHKILVLEAQDRVGGRLLNSHTLKSGKTVDIGGQWSAPQQKYLLDMIKKLGLKQYEQFDDGDTVCELSGNYLTRYKGLIPSVSWMSLIDLQILLWDIDSKAATIDPEYPWKCENAEKWDKMTAEDYIKSKLWTQTATDLFNIFIHSVFACEAYEISFFSCLFYISSAGGTQPLMDFRGGGQDSKIEGGAQNIPILLAKKLGDSVITSCPVRKIDQNQKDVVEITTDKGIFKCKFVIQAIPPLMYPRIQHSPILPPEKELLSQRMPMGFVIKTITLFKTTWWREKGYNGLFTSIGGPLRFGCDLTTDKGLVGFIYNKEYGQKTEKERLDEILKQFSRIFDTDLKNIQNELLDYVEKDWSKEEFIRGAYEGYLIPGGMKFFKYIREPFDRIHYAGTETGIHWNGYMNGGIQAGQRAAKEVMEKLK